MAVKHIKKLQLIYILGKELIKNPHSILDIGCGIRPQKLVKPDVHICIEPHQEYIDKLDKDKYVIIKDVADSILPKFPDNSIDTVVLSDVIEHIDKSVGIAVLKEIERVASKQIIIFTPYGYLEQEEDGELDAWGMHGIEWQKHRSGWTENDFNNDWDIYIIDDFHKYNTSNVKYETPKPAMYAIKTFNKNIKKPWWSAIWKK